jgi:hypothetical protein
MKVSALAASVAFALITHATPAHADATADELSPWVWGIAAAELSGTGCVALRLADTIPSGGAADALLLAPMVVGLGTGFAAYHWKPDARPALATHGALWSGFDLFLLGTLIDGRDEPGKMRIGTAAWTLGAVGAAAGGFLGATAGYRAPTVWLMAPAVGFMAGLVTGGVLVATGDGTGNAQRLAGGLIGGLTVATTAAAIWGYTRPAPAATRGISLTPRLEPGPKRMMVSFGGTF